MTGEALPATAPETHAHRVITHPCDGSAETVLGQVRELARELTRKLPAPGISA